MLSAMTTGTPRFQNLRGQVQVALKVGRVHEVDDGVGAVRLSR